MLLALGTAGQSTSDIMLAHCQLVSLAKNPDPTGWGRTEALAATHCVETFTRTGPDGGGLARTGPDPRGQSRLGVAIAKASDF